MFWETKLLELQKLAPVELEQKEGQWFATIKAAINAPYHANCGSVGIGETKAAAVVALWSHIVNGNEPFLINLARNKRKVRWNARWEVLEEINEPTELVVEEPEPNEFDQAD